MNTEERDILSEMSIKQVLQECEKIFKEKDPDFNSAEKKLNDFISKCKTEPLAYQIRAEVFLKQGKYIQALHDMESAMLLDPSLVCCKSSEEHYQIKKGLMRMSNDI